MTTSEEIRTDTVPAEPHTKGKATCPTESPGRRRDTSANDQPTMTEWLSKVDAIAVDAGCSGNPGPMEYQGVALPSGRRIFHFGPIHGTNNIGEFLAIVHALALLEQAGNRRATIYSDSYNAILWVSKKHCKTKLESTDASAKAHELVRRAESWLQNHDVHNPIKKWETKEWGEIPADFGRKK